MATERKHFGTDGIRGTVGQAPITPDFVMRLAHAVGRVLRQTDQHPVVLIGKAEGVANGGILSQTRRELELWALPAAIPEKLEVDVTPLKIAIALHINDVKLPAEIGRAHV